jgi:putative addiction module component (TIGR02574 family)
MQDYESLRKQALRLSTPERTRLLSDLFETLTNTPQREREIRWAVEAEKRLQGYDEGKIDSEDWNQLRKRLTV